MRRLLNTAQNGIDQLTLLFSFAIILGTHFVRFLVATDFSVSAGAGVASRNL